MRKIVTSSVRQPLLWFVLSVTCVMTFQNCADNFKSASSESIDAAQSLNVKYTIMLSSNKDVESPSPNQNFVFAAPSGHENEIASFTCQLDDAAPATCTSPYSTTGLVDGHHTLVLSGKNSVGFSIATGAYHFTVDTTSPTLTLTQAPGAIVGSSSITLAFNAADALTGVGPIMCSFDGAAAQIVANPYATPGLADGNHTANCNTKDGAGNISNSITASWRTSLNAPAIMLDASLPAYSGTMNFIKYTTSSSTQSAITTSCSLDSGAFAACTTGQQYTGLAAGNHTITVKAIDVLNRQSTMAYTWTVDLTAPSVRITTIPTTYTNLRAFPIAFAVDDGTGSGAGPCECASGQGATMNSYTSCTSPYNLSTSAEGVFKASIRCMDAVGNQSAAASYSITFDHTPPTFSYASNVVALSANQTAMFSFAGTDTVSNPVRFQTQMDAGTYVDSPSPFTITGLADGHHVILIRAVDDAGNTTSPQSLQWTVDTMPPTLPGGVHYTSLDSAWIYVNYTASTDAGSGVDHYEVKIGTTDGGTDLMPVQIIPATAASPYEVPYSFISKNVGGTYVHNFSDRVSYIQMRAFDKMGNASAWASSGVTSSDLYDQNFPYALGCGFGTHCTVKKLDTSYTALTSGTISGSSYTLVQPNQVVRLESYFTTDPLTDTIKHSPGTLSETCTLSGNYVFPCDLVTGLVIPTLVTNQPQSLHVDVYYNGQIFYQVDTTVLQTTAFSKYVTTTPMPTASAALAYIPVTFATYKDAEKQVWLDNSGTSRIDEMCLSDNWSNPPAGTLVARNASKAIIGTNYCKMSIYADYQSMLLLSDVNSAAITAVTGATIFYDPFFGGSRITKLSYVSAIPDIASCPYSATGACPADTLSFK